MKTRNKMYLLEKDASGSLEVYSDGSRPAQGEFDADLNWYDIDRTLGRSRLLDYLVVSVTKKGITIAGNNVAFCLTKGLEDDQAACLSFIKDNIKVPIDPKELIKLGFKEV